MLNIKTNLRIFYLNNVSLYYLVKSFKNTGQFPTKKHHNLVIEAYPSSANSFLYVLVKNIFKNSIIAHHSHSVASLKEALKWDIPIAIVIRNPLDAIASRHARFKDNLELCILEYISFYSYVLKNSQKMLIFSFEDLTNNIYFILKKIALKTGCEFNYSVEDISKFSKDAFIEIDEHYLAKGRLHVSATPSKDRDLEKKDIKPKILNHRLYTKAESIYSQIIKYIRK